MILQLTLIENLYALLRNRGYEPDPTDEIIKTNEQLQKRVRSLKSMRYVVIKFKPVKTFRKHNLCVGFMTEGKDVSKVRDELRKNKCDVMMVSDVPNKNLLQPQRNGVYYEEHINHIPIQEIKTECVLCMPHRVLPPSERKQINLYGAQPPYILFDDVMNVWTGGRPGELVEITRFSEQAEFPIAYRQVR